MTHSDEGHPAEAYSRVTDSERFRSLHDAGLKLLARLEQEYAVLREEGLELEGPPESLSLARPSVRLVPRSLESAPIVISFTEFPGIYLNFGRYSAMAFPPCGCDACGGSGEEESVRLSQAISDVTAGRFREEVDTIRGRRANVRWSLWSERGRTDGGREVREVNLPPSWKFHPRTDWQPWPRR